MGHHCEGSHGEVSPKAFERLNAAEESGEDRGVGKEDVAGTVCIGRHPEEVVELAVPCLGEGMRSGHVDGLSG